MVITVTGVGPVGSADTATATESQTLTVNTAGGVLTNDTGGDTESLAVTNVSSNGTSNSGAAGAGVLGTYGTLTVAADGSYTYIANTAAAEALDAGDSETDVFTYTVKDDDDVGLEDGDDLGDDEDLGNVGEDVGVEEGKPADE